ncbi:LysM peptidoglycan-binding domain-containing protein [Micromonospora sp. DT81.3]|uniref:LysM peptidoglycan-binding domain-containing protein n=1 Tax=Micromonospora sp. DT81.3 TaxID=3416523 RepID=UPI003CF5A51C
MPAAIVGSIALSLGATPAAGVEREVRAPGVPGALPKAFAMRPGAVPQLRPHAVEAPGSHVVVSGDSVFAIAQRFGLRTADVLAWNGLSSSSVIHPGQVLVLSGTTVAAPAAPTPPATMVAPPPTAPVAPAGSHTVAAGDTISGIAKKYGTTVPAVLAANGLDASSIIYPGQTIAISGAPASAPPEPAAPPAAPAAPPAAASTHTVGAGDTISGIANKYGTTTQAVLDANGLTRSSIIYPGEVLTLPGAMTLAVATAPAPAPAPAPAGPPPQQSAVLDAEQVANAHLIIGIGRQLGVSQRGIAIALATAMVESSMRNLDWGDRDSLGLFQQRPSAGWGTEAQVSDATRATQAFYGGSGDPNGHLTRGLLDIPGWESMPFTEAAQAVQISAYPDRYGGWEAAAHQWLAALG